MGSDSTPQGRSYALSRVRGANRKRQFEIPMNTMHDDELKEEYTEGDLKDGVRGKYYAAYQKSHNVVRLDPDVSAAFPDEVYSALEQDACSLRDTRYLGPDNWIR